MDYSLRSSKKPGDPATPAPLTWRVSSQIEAVGPDADGKIVQGVRVYFTLSNGQTSSVFVPHASYDAATVRAMIQSRVDTITEVGNLGSSNPSNRAS